jgi:hypothetical protein
VKLNFVNRVLIMIMNKNSNIYKPVPYFYCDPCIVDTIRNILSLELECWYSGCKTEYGPTNGPQAGHALIYSYVIWNQL